MAELVSVGLDVGTTSTQMVVSRLGVQNRAGAFSVPELDISSREILYESPVHFTPLLGVDRVDGAALRALVEAEYRRAGIRREDVDTGAVIITGETSRKENAREVLEHLSDLAGDFVVATAGPDLESVLAAKGAGAVEFSGRTGKTVLHFDIGGGTSNLALVVDGHITATACLNVGGRLVKVEHGKISYVSPVLQGIFQGRAGDPADRGQLESLARKLAQVLEMAAGLGEAERIPDNLVTKEAGGLPASIFHGGREKVISFSGGVADCIEKEQPWDAFGDIGVLLGKAIRESRLCRGEYRLGEQTIRATVIGAGCHSTQLTGSTVFIQNVNFPLKNLPVVENAEELPRLDGPGVLVIPGEAMDFSGVRDLAKELAGKLTPPIYIAAAGDMAKALGTQLALGLGRDAPILCIDRVRLRAGDYLDVAAPIGPALPVVVKTLVLER